MWATFVAEANPIKIAFFAALLLPPFLANARAADDLRDDSLQAAHEAYAASYYSRAAQLLKQAAEQRPRDAEIQWFVAKQYYESEQHNAAIASAEKAVALDPQSSLYHEWLGKAYGEKAGHASMFSALSLAKKTRKEFEKAVELDEKNFSAHQALIEFDCSAPGIAGGGEDKARPEIAKLAALDPAEGHYAEGNCRRQKKDFVAADAEFAKALELHPKSAELVYDIRDYAMKQGQAETLVIVAEQGQEIAPLDPRSKFYRGVAWVIKNKHYQESERLLREYLKRAPIRNGFPPAWRGHERLGRLYAISQRTPEAGLGDQNALKNQPKPQKRHED